MYSDQSSKKKEANFTFIFWQRIKIFNSDMTFDPLKNYLISGTGKWDDDL